MKTNFCLLFEWPLKTGSSVVCFCIILTGFKNLVFNNLHVSQAKVFSRYLFFSGVFSVLPIANETQFGPYVGKIVPAEDAKGIERRYSWEVNDYVKQKIV